MQPGSMGPWPPGPPDRMRIHDLDGPVKKRPQSKTVGQGKSDASNDPKSPTDFPDPEGQSVHQNGEHVGSEGVAEDSSEEDGDSD